MKREDTDITEAETGMEKNVINRHQHHWEKVFEKTCSMFGDEPSYPARKAASVFERKERIKSSNWMRSGKRYLFFCQ